MTVADLVFDTLRDLGRAAACKVAQHYGLRLCPCKNVLYAAGSGPCPVCDH